MENDVKSRKKPPGGGFFCWFYRRYRVFAGDCRRSQPVHLQEIAGACDIVHLQEIAGVAIMCICRKLSVADLVQLCDPGDPYINVGNFIPGSKVSNSCLRQSEYVLEFPYSGGSLRAINTVWPDPGNGRIYLGNGI